MVLFSVFHIESFIIWCLSGVLNININNSILYFFGVFYPRWLLTGVLPMVLCPGCSILPSVFPRSSISVVLSLVLHHRVLCLLLFLFLFGKVFVACILP